MVVTTEHLDMNRFKSSSPSKQMAKNVKTIDSKFEMKAMPGYSRPPLGKANPNTMVDIGSSSYLYHRNKRENLVRAPFMWS